MKIQRSVTYSVELYEEPNTRNDHTRVFVEKLKFTGLDLINAIISAGMPDTYLTTKERRNRRDEIAFKINLFETYVVSSPAGELSFDKSKKRYLDATEIGAINYWIGMILITMLGQKKYHYDYMVHLSMLEHFSSTITLTKRTFYSVNGNPTYMSPDLLAVNSANRTYGVFESKGYSTYSKKAMEHGYDQVKSIIQVNSANPTHRFVVMTQTDSHSIKRTGSNIIKMIQKDPDGENCEISVDYDFLHIYHFLPIVELITELSHKEYNGRMYASFEYHDEVYHISIPLVLYNNLSRIMNCDNSLSASQAIMETNLKELHSNIVDQNIFCVE